MIQTPAPSTFKYFGANAIQRRSPVPASTSAPRSSVVFRLNARNEASCRSVLTQANSNLLLPTSREKAKAGLLARGEGFGAGFDQIKPNSLNACSSWEAAPHLAELQRASVLDRFLLLIWTWPSGPPFDWLMI